MNHPSPLRRRSALGAMACVSLTVCLVTTATAGAASPTGMPGGFGASGSVAAISGTSMEVQSQQSGQTTVNWTASTTFSRTVTTSLAAVRVGDCVTATGTSTKGTITAKAVTVATAQSGTCARTGGFGGAGGATPGGAKGFAPPSGSGNRPEGGSGSGGGAPTGGARGVAPGMGNVGFASGKVTKVSGKSLVLSGFSSQAPGKKPTGKSTKAIPVTVKVTGATTYTGSETAAASDLAVGDCVTAAGKTSTTGSVAASTIRITSSGKKSCTAGRFPGAAQGG